jgi:hypothetical protein
MFNSFNYKNYNCKEMLQETEQRRLSAVKSMQNIIDSIIYAMYTRGNFEYCWGCLEVILNIAFIYFHQCLKTSKANSKR